MKASIGKIILKAEQRQVKVIGLNIKMAKGIHHLV